MKILKGREAEHHFVQIASLRIGMFKEFPYLYDGSIQAERDYLDVYFKSPNSSILLVFDANNVIGFSSSIPLSEELKDIQQPIINSGLDPNDCLYIGECMIKKDYRGRGLLRKFFKYHETCARTLLKSHSVFMTVQREATHPERPSNYRDLEPVWEHCGYNKLPNATIEMSWRRIDTRNDDLNFLDLWIKPL